jgi:hypothetical protein
LAYSFEFNSTCEIFLVRFEGTVTEAEFLEYYRLAGEHMTRLRPRATISDYSGVADFQVSVQTLRDLAHSYIAMPSDNPRYVIAPAAHLYGLARMFQMEGEATRPNLQVVSTLAEAYTLLNVENPRFEPVGGA